MFSDLLVRRFWQKVNKLDNESCWLWTAGRSDGYGVMSGEVEIPGIRPKNVYAHIVSYVTHRGEIPSGLTLRHSCRNRHCVNPNHLSVGTYADNTQDSIRDGTNYFSKRIHAAKGEDCGSSRVTEEIVRTIRARWSRKDCPTQRVLAEEFGISTQQISNIVNYNDWVHV